MQDELAGMLLTLIHERRGQPGGDLNCDVLGTIVHGLDEHGEMRSDAQVLSHLNILLVGGTRQPPRWEPERFTCSPRSPNGTGAMQLLLGGEVL